MVPSTRRGTVTTLCKLNKFNLASTAEMSSKNRVRRDRRPQESECETPRPHPGDSHSSWPSAREWSPSRIMTPAPSASHRRAARATMPSNTLRRSPGLALMSREDLAGRGLQLEGLGELAVALLDLAQQPRVLDRDGRLVGEGLQEGNLGAGVAASHRPAHDDAAHRHPVTQHRDARHLDAGRTRYGGSRELIGRAVVPVVDGDRLAREDGGAARSKCSRSSIPRGPRCGAGRSPYCNLSPCRSTTTALLLSHRRIACSTIRSNTGCRSKRAVLTASSTSVIARWRANDSSRSLNNLALRWRSPPARRRPGRCARGAARRGRTAERIQIQDSDRAGRRRPRRDQQQLRMSAGISGRTAGQIVDEADAESTSPRLVESTPGRPTLVRRSRGSSP